MVTSGLLNSWMKSHGLPWPRQSLDIKITECLWDVLEYKVDGELLHPSKVFLLVQTRMEVF